MIITIGNTMWNINPESLKTYFPEIANHSRKCKIINCRHLQEIGCAVKLAVKEKNIRKDRYESYLKLMKDFNAVQIREKNAEQKNNDKKIFAPKTIEEELRLRFKVRVRENQKGLNLENIIRNLSLVEKTECLELLCKLDYIEVLDISRNGEIFLSEKINNLTNLRKLRIDKNAIQTERDKEFLNELKKKGIIVTIYSI